uniref:Flavin-containing monooxygenase n=1 Tax=Brassica campestris TaxID=3711 RepID=M4F6E5_BRACM
MVDSSIIQMAPSSSSIIRRHVAVIGAGAAGLVAARELRREDDNRVGPLYKHIFSPASAPSLSFIGITWKVLLFHLFELQSKWIAGVLSGRITLPWKGYDGGN